MTDFAGNTCILNSVLNGFRAIFYAIGKFYQFLVQVCTVFIRIGGVNRSLNVCGNWSIVARAFFQMKYGISHNVVLYLLKNGLKIFIRLPRWKSFRGNPKGERLWHIGAFLV
jgi:hypothetical protein